MLPLIQEHGLPFVSGCIVAGPPIYGFLTRTLMAQVREMLTETRAELEKTKAERDDARQQYVALLNDLRKA